MSTSFPLDAGENGPVSGECCYSLCTDGNGSSCEISFSFLL
jgi:hypothetical protein